MPLRVHNWRAFQHYQSRRPPWVKLHRTLLDDYDFIRLPLASQALAPRLWLLASESTDGSLPDDPAKLAFRLHCSEVEITEAVNPLISGGFLEGLLSASTALAVRKRNLISETETETEAERTTDSVAPAPASPAPPVSVPASVVQAPANPLAKVAAPSWSREACDDWQAYLGTAPGGRVGGALKLLVREHGWERVRPIWRDACEQAALEADPSYFTPEVFARTFKARLSSPKGGRRKPSVQDRTEANLREWVASKEGA